MNRSIFGALALALCLAASAAAAQAVQPFTANWDRGGSNHGQATPWGWQEGYFDAVRRINTSHRGQFPLPQWCESFCVAGLGIRGACLKPGATFTLHMPVNAACFERAERSSRYRGTGSPWARAECPADNSEFLRLFTPSVRHAIIASGGLSSVSPVTLDTAALNAAGIPYCRQ